MTTRTAYPPSYHHGTTIAAPKDAQDQLAAFLARTPTTAYLHPDAMLRQNGIQFPAQSGPQGGLALHHLRRIEAGLRGESLVVESREDLKALFATEQEPELPAGDDTRLDAVIADPPNKPGKRARSAERVEKWRNAEANEALDPEEYAHQQGEIEEDIGNDTISGNGVQRTSMPDLETTAKSSADKAARKAAKKAKKLEQKKKSAEQKAAG